VATVVLTIYSAVAAPTDPTAKGPFVTTVVTVGIIAALGFIIFAIFEFIRDSQRDERERWAAS
jgi:predicted permease